jgi:phosphatidylserine/phosphatidylglycerophosphate/cardiolipin synthase-like enzyme
VQWPWCHYTSDPSTPSCDTLWPTKDFTWDPIIWPECALPEVITQDPAAFWCDSTWTHDPVWGPQCVDPNYTRDAVVWQWCNPRYTTDPALWAWCNDPAYTQEPQTWPECSFEPTSDAYIWPFCHYTSDPYLAACSTPYPTQDYTSNPVLWPGCPVPDPTYTGEPQQWPWCDSAYTNDPYIWPECNVVYTQDPQIWPWCNPNPNYTTNAFAWPECHYTSNPATWPECEGQFPTKDYTQDASIWPECGAPDYTLDSSIWPWCDPVQYTSTPQGWPWCAPNWTWDPEEWEECQPGYTYDLAIWQLCSEGLYTQESATWLECQLYTADARIWPECHYTSDPNSVLCNGNWFPTKDYTTDIILWPECARDPGYTSDLNIWPECHYTSDPATWPECEVSTYSISGHVRDSDNNSIQGIVVSAGPNHSATTDATGAYTIDDLPAGTYTIAPDLTAWNVTPASLSVAVPPDADGKDFTASCSPASLSPIGQAVYTLTYDLAGDQLFCSSALDQPSQFIRLPYFPPDFGGKYAFKQFAELAADARYEVDFVSMSWDDEKAPGDDADPPPGDDSPMVIFLRGVRELYDKVQDHPQDYPAGVKVRILTGLQYHHVELRDQRLNILRALDTLDVPLQAEDPLPPDKWQVEVGAYRKASTFPLPPPFTVGRHSHVKMLIVDGETAIVAGYNMEYNYLSVGESLKGGTRHPWYDAGVQVSGAVAHRCLEVFDGLWLQARLCRAYSETEVCSPSDPSDCVILYNCADEATAPPADHVQEVRAIHLADTPNTQAVFSLFRDDQLKLSDYAIEAALKAAENNVKILQNRYFDLNPFDGDDPFWAYERGVMDAVDNGAAVQLIIPDCRYQPQDCLINLVGALSLRLQAPQVQIGMFPEPIHGKAVTIDGQFLIVGSQNWDFSAFGTGEEGDPWPFNVDLAEYNLGIDSGPAAEEFNLWYDGLWQDVLDFVPAETWGEVQEALQNATRGVVISLNEGIYQVQSKVESGGQKIATEPVSLIGAGPGKTVIECETGGITPLTFTSSSSVLGNLTIRNCSLGARFSSTSAEGIQNIRIFNVVFENNTDGGVMIESLVPGSPVDFTLTNNTFVGGAAGLIINVSQTQAVTSTVNNNIFSGQLLAPVEILSTDDGRVEYSYNLFYDCGGGACLTSWHLGNFGPASTAHDNLFDLNPRFVDPGQGDYRLSPGSPAIDAGDPTILHELVYDGNLDGVPRIDIGAFEAWVRAIYLPLVVRDH